MVATRRGVRVDFSETNQKITAQAPPSTGRRTRSSAKEVEGVQQTFEKTCVQLSLTPVTSATKRCTRNLTLHSPPLLSTPAGSIHEADLTEGESVCSAVSTAEPPVTRSRGRNGLLRTGNQENEEVSEVESCSSVASASTSGLRSRRSTRRKTVLPSSDSAQAEVGDVKPDLGSEAESCSSAMSNSQRVTRSQKKTAFTRSSAKLQTVDSEVSDSDSCPSSILGRVSRRRMRPIPINLDELSESSQSSQTRSTGKKAAATVDIAEPSTYDSEGFQSGPTYSLSRNDKMQPAGCKTGDSEFEMMEVSSPVGSPCSTQSRETPSSSRANSGTSSQGCPALRRSARKRGDVTENTAESADSRLESTMIADDEENRTLLEEDQIQSSEKAGEESATIIKDQEEALSPDDKDEDISDVEMMQETVTPSEQAQPGQSVTAASPEKASETTEDEEKQEAAAELTEEEEEVSRLKTATQKVVEDSVAQSTKIISLLDSSDDEDDDFGEEAESEEEEEKRGGPSNMSAASVKGLFMIDTRPGQDADELYYREKEEVTNLRLDQEEEDEEFVDEEGEDDDDEDTQILLSSRSSRLKEMSSRIDPGIRVKELGGLYISFDGSKSKPVSSSQQKEKKNLDEVMTKSVIGPDFEKKEAVPPYSESKQALKLKRRAEREKSTGNGWFNMKAPELTPDLKRDLKVLKMRGSLDPKRFYKKNDRDGFPKYFQIGTVVDNPADFYHSQIPKKARKRTMVEELLADAEFRHKNKKRYQKIMAEQAAQGADRRRRKKKFHKK